MNPTLEEIAWLYSWLKEHKEKMPGGRSSGPHYNASCWDLDDLFRAFREDAVGSRDRVWQAVLKRGQSGAWPKMKSSDAFWLRERWLMAERYCREVLEEGSNPVSQIPVSSPKDTQATIEWLLLDLWDDTLVDLWIRENARDYVYADHYKSEEAPEELERYLRKLESS
jgi:hypothetical protein